jgi:hypothetical protein
MSILNEAKYGLLKNTSSQVRLDYGPKRWRITGVLHSSRGLDCNLAEDQIKQGMSPDVREDLEHLEATHIIPRGRNELDLPEKQFWLFVDTSAVGSTGELKNTS